MNVPKATMNKDHLFPTGEADIRTAGKGPREPIPVPKVEKELSDGQFRPRVAAANTPHVLAAADRHPRSLLCAGDSLAWALCSSVNEEPAPGEPGRESCMRLG